MHKQISLSENGQSLVLVVLGLFAFVAILALVLDGGNAYAAKRQAQNAADAGALAGADVMCKKHNESDGESAAISYMDKNGAYLLKSSAEGNLENATMTATATVHKKTFFAGIIGFDYVDPMAVAVAQCQTPGGRGILPVAWACRETTLGGGVTLPGIDCTQKIYNINCFDKYNGECTYILMDSVKVQDNKKGGNCDPTETNPLDPKYCYQQNDLVCSAHINVASPPDPPYCPTVEPNTTDCDLNNDCIDELMTGGARSWLDLDGGGGGANELTSWIKNGFPGEIKIHTWLPEEPGVATSIFHTAAAVTVGKDVILPVFDKMCQNSTQFFNSNPETNDACAYGTESAHPDTTVWGNDPYFHVISFSAFHVTCVQTGNNKVDHEAGYIHYKNGSIDPNQQSANYCNGHEQAAHLYKDPNPPHKYIGPIDDNDKTIEGYFIEENLGGYGGSGGANTGAYTVVLIQ